MDDDDDDGDDDDDDDDDDASKQTAGNWRFESSGRDTQPALPSVPNSSKHFFFIFLSYSLLNCTFSFSYCFNSTNAFLKDLYHIGLIFTYICPKDICLKFVGV